jgi:hypothetical protein
VVVYDTLLREATPAEVTAVVAHELGHAKDRDVAVGTLTGALIGMGIPEYEAKRYESFISSGGMLLSVHCSDRDMEKRARSILDGFGASEIGKEHEVRTHADDKRH